MSVSILQVLGTLPGGNTGVALGIDELAQYLRENYGTEEERARNERHALRDKLYRDGGAEKMATVIDEVFKHEAVRELRKVWVPYARFNNAAKRIVREISTVYQEPAKREVDGAGNDNYQFLLRLVRMDETTVESNRLYNLHRVIFWGFRIRTLADGRKEPVLDIWTPTNVRVVTHPNDATLVVGYLLRVGSKPARDKQNAPTWALWTDHERALLNDQFVAIDGTWVEHGYVDSEGRGVCPIIPICAYPSPSGFWPGEEGEDLVAATISIWLTNLLLLKETKSNTRQTTLAGDVSNMQREQAIESEAPLVVPDGVGVSSLDATTDPRLYTDPVNHILEGTGNNYGLSMTLLKHQGVQSADAREIIRAPLYELRREQQTPFRRAEERLALVMSAVVEKDLPEFKFVVEKWRMDFGEARTPLTESENVDLHLKKRGAGLDNPIDFLMRENPDLVEPLARALVQRNVKTMTWYVGIMRDLQAKSGGMREEAPDTAQGEGDDEGDDEGDNNDSQGSKAA